MKGVRIFIGIELEDETRQILQTSAKNLETCVEKGRFARAENYHLTLHFLGEMDEKALERVKTCTANTAKCFECFELELGKIGAFTKKNRKIIWAGISNGTYHLDRVYKTLEEQLIEAGFPIERSPYTPHITFGRQFIVDMSDDALSQAAGLPAHKFYVRNITVFESTRVNDLLTYVPLQRYELK